MIHDLITRAAEEPIVTFGAAAIGSIIVGTLTFFFHRAVNRGDKATDRMSDSVSALRETVGQLKMVNEAQWKQIDELRNKLEKLQDKFYEVKR